MQTGPVILTTRSSVFELPGSLIFHKNTYRGHNVHTRLNAHIVENLWDIAWKWGPLQCTTKEDDLCVWWNRVEVPKLSQLKNQGPHNEAPQLCASKGMCNVKIFLMFAKAPWNYMLVPRGPGLLFGTPWVRDREREDHSVIPL